MTSCSARVGIQIKSMRAKLVCHQISVIGISNTIHRFYPAVTCTISPKASTKSTGVCVMSLLFSVAALYRCSRAASDTCICTASLAAVNPS